MSFGFSIGDAILLTQIATRTVQNSRKACGVHDDLTREVSSLLLVLRRLEAETAKPDSLINKRDDPCQEELQSLVAGCKKTLGTLEKILDKYNALSEEQRSGRKLWQRIRFGNGEMQDLAELRATLVYYTSAISLFINMISMGSIGRVEKRMDEAGGVLHDIRLAVNGITAQLLAGNNREGSVLTNYTDDDKAVWKEFRRELVKDGFLSSTIHRHKELIKAYISELAARGLLDEQDPSVVHEECIDVASDCATELSSASSDSTRQAEEVVKEIPRSDNPDDPNKQTRRHLDGSAPKPRYAGVEPRYACKPRYARNGKEDQKPQPLWSLDIGQLLGLDDYYLKFVVPWDKLDMLDQKVSDIPDDEFRKQMATDILERLTVLYFDGNGTYEVRRDRLARECCAMLQEIEDEETMKTLKKGRATANRTSDDGPLNTMKQQTEPQNGERRWPFLNERPNHWREQEGQERDRVRFSLEEEDSEPQHMKADFEQKKRKEEFHQRRRREPAEEGWFVR